MDTRTQDVPGYYVWEATGLGVIVHLSLDVVDRMSADVMRGFGAIRKRGAEIGGLLLGSIEEGFPALVRVEDYVAVPCEYRRGPSYLFTEEDSSAFEEAYERSHPIGYFRSHTRDGFELCDDDIQLLDHFFPKSSNIALLVRPHATKTSAAGIFVRENGHFQRTTGLEFPFKREQLLSEQMELTLGENEPEDRVSAEAPAFAPHEEKTISGSFSAEPVAPSLGMLDATDRSSPVLPPEPDAMRMAPARSERAGSGRFKGSRSPASWIWIPLSFLFLLFGGVLGFEASRSMSSGIVAADNYSLALRAAKSDANVGIRWNGQSPAVEAATRGQLVIEDGDARKIVDLDAAQLRNGSLVYHNISPKVRLRLSVFPRSQVSITETMEWSEPAAR